MVVLQSARNYNVNSKLGAFQNETFIAIELKGPFEQNHNDHREN